MREVDCRRGEMDASRGKNKSSSRFTGGASETRLQLEDDLRGKLQVERFTRTETRGAIEITDRV